MASPHPSLNPFGMGPFHSRRSTVMGTRGVVASSQPLASSAGISILEQGGNAADAAVAVAAALNVTEPCSTGIGGDAFCLFWDAEKRQVRGLNASGRSPAAMSLDSLKKAGVTDGIGLQSVHSVTVPGAAASWVDTVEKFGSGKLTLEDILAPAIRLADGGYPVHEITSKAWVASEAKIKAASPNGDEMMLPGSKRAPKQGEIMRMPNLARTFREVAIKGKAGYYKGRIAQAIVDVLKQKGGLMELEDLAKHAEVGSEEITPISYEYGNSGPNAHDGVTLHECPPNGQGPRRSRRLGCHRLAPSTGKDWRRGKDGAQLCRIPAHTHRGPPLRLCRRPPVGLRPSPRRPGPSGVDAERQVPRRAVQDL
ncbi:hypothetical protein L7F22_011827 [Adiantum nelumboides]|nr:hypothetical protein [Adiantum nelumboides]